jgi:polar amino acid transport system ATP-binding protein
VAIARALADVVVIVMDHGAIIETGPPSTILIRPTNERTRAFLQAVLAPDRS